MVNVSPVEVCGETYNVVHASAVKQKELVMLLMLLTTGVSASTDKEIDTALLIGVLLSLGDDMIKLNRVESIVLNKVVKQGTETPISIDDFKNNMAAYYTLIAEAIKVNIQDFFVLVDKLRKDNNKIQSQMMPD